MEKRNRDGWRADERYYNRGQTEDALDREGRAFVSSFWNEPYSPEINPVMGLTAYEMCRVFFLFPFFFFFFFFFFYFYFFNEAFSQTDRQS
jgi:hypothetical protein